MSETVKKLNVHQASLCYRFNTSDGWTRSKVAEYLNHDEAINYVMPRYYDGEKDRVLKWDRGWYMSDTSEYSDCDYYAIHNAEVEKLLDMDRLKAEHNVVPFNL